MFDKICTRLCLHTRAARIAFFSSVIFIATVTFLAAVYWFEPQAMVPPIALRDMNRQELAANLGAGLQPAEGEVLLQLAWETAGEGDRLMQNYHFLRSQERQQGALTTEQVRQRFAALKGQWETYSQPYRQVENPWAQALLHDLDEAIALAEDGLSRGTPFINQRLVKARGMFHDLAQVILTDEKSNDYYGETGLGRLVEKQARP